LQVSSAVVFFALITFLSLALHLSFPRCKDRKCEACSNSGCNSMTQSCSLSGSSVLSASPDGSSSSSLSVSPVKDDHTTDRSGIFRYVGIEYRVSSEPSF